MVRLNVTPVLLLLLLTTAPLLVRAHIHSQKVVKFHGREGVPLETWLAALCSALLVSSCGVLPLAFSRWINLEQASGKSNSLNIVLSFAAGSLLGDVWLHLLPESTHQSTHQTGLWVIIGLITFMTVERVATSLDNALPNDRPQDMSGYLNLVANCTDNFTHGLAIASSYIISPLVGALTTLAIVCHEVPHEIGDFAILLRSGFTCTNAARAQLVTAVGSLVGVAIGLSAEHIGQCTAWMLPFTGGGFLYIALVSIVPELMEERRGALMSAAQVISMLFGIAIMAAVTIVERKSCSFVPEVFAGSHD